MHDATDIHTERSLRRSHRYPLSSEFASVSPPSGLEGRLNNEVFLVVTLKFFKIQCFQGDNGLGFAGRAVPAPSFDCNRLEFLESRWGTQLVAERRHMHTELTAER